MDLQTTESSSLRAGGIYFTAERKEHLIPIQLLEYQMLWDGGRRFALINKLTPRAIAANHVYYCGNRNV